MAEQKQTKVAALGVKEMCERYSISQPTFYRWQKDGLVPPPVHIGKTRRWLLSTLERWEAEGCPKIGESLSELLKKRSEAFAKMEEIATNIVDTDDLDANAKAEFIALLKEVENADERRRRLIETAELEDVATDREAGQS